MENCGAHQLLVENVQHLRASIEKIGDEVSEANVRTSTLELQIEMWREEAERQQATLAETMIKGFTSLSDRMSMMERRYASTKWKPVNIVALAGAVLAPAAVVVSAWLMRGDK